MRMKKDDEELAVVAGRECRGKAVMGKWLIVSEVRGVKSEIPSPNCEVRNTSDFTLRTSDLSLYPEPESNRYECYLIGF